MNVKRLSNGYVLALEVTVALPVCLQNLYKHCVCVCKRLDKFVDQTNQIILSVFAAPKGNFGEHSHLSL